MNTRIKDLYSLIYRRLYLSAKRRILLFCWNSKIILC